MNRITLTSDGRRYIQSTLDSDPEPWEDHQTALEWFIMARLYSGGKTKDVESLAQRITVKETGQPVGTEAVRRAVARLYEMGMVDVKED